MFAQLLPWWEFQNNPERHDSSVLLLRTDFQYKGKTISAFGSTCKNKRWTRKRKATKWEKIKQDKSMIYFTKNVCALVTEIAVLMFDVDNSNLCPICKLKWH